MEAYIEDETLAAPTAEELRVESVDKHETDAKERFAGLLKRHSDWSYLGGNNPNADGFYDF